MDNPAANDDHAILPFDDLNIEPLDQAEIEQRASDWYATWRERIRVWISAHSDDQFAQVVLLVPDLLALLVRLARDPRVPLLVKARLLLAAAYVISPVDLMPEAVLGVIGLADDAGVLALTLMWIQGVAGLDPLVLRENWAGSGDVIAIIDQLHTQISANADRWFDPQVWHQLRCRFGKIWDKRRWLVK